MRENLYRTGRLIDFIGSTGREEGSASLQFIYSNATIVDGSLQPIDTSMNLKSSSPAEIS